MDLDDADRESISDRAEMGPDRESDLGRVDDLYQLFSTLSDRMEKGLNLWRETYEAGEKMSPCATT